MRIQALRLRAAAAFTLVELLVVIGIIALLISILLPSLNAARQQANTLKCLANLHSIGEAIAIYTGTSKGTLPYGYWSGSASPANAPTAAETDRAGDWGILLTSTLGKGFGSYTTQKGSDQSKVQGMFTCPAAKFDSLSQNSRKLHYASHPRLMPDLATVDGIRGGNATTGPWLRPYKLTAIKRSTDIALIFDAAQVANFDYNANATANNLDNSGLYYASGSPPGKQFNYLVSAAGMDLNQAIYATNGDSPSNPNSAYDIRWRHNRNDTANFLFVDGHAGSFRLRFGQNADAKMLNFYVDSY